MKFLTSTLAALGLQSVVGEVYFKEQFNDDSWKDNWVVSSWKQAAGQAGEFTRTAGDFYGDADANQGLQTSTDARFYAISRKMDKPFDNKDKDFVVQFSVKHGQKIDCGGGYLKLFPPGLDQSKMEGDSKYNIMFGPDICGSSTKKTHVIFEKDEENHLINKDISCESDQLTHVYTLIVHPDNTYEVKIDGESKQTGSLEEDWDMLLPKEIKDPEQSKPADWVDETMIDDPEDVKPEGYDDIPKTIVDPDAEKPDDWDDESDGEWEAPEIDNPEYKGPWNAKRIPNPDYKGQWEHPVIPNPDFEEDSELYRYTFETVGIDIWQVKAGSIFDDIIITDSAEEAQAFLEETWGKTHEAEKKMFDDKEAEKRAEEAAERERLEAERAAAEEEDDEDDDEDDEEEDLDAKIKAAKDEL
jgi:calreticulin